MPNQYLENLNFITIYTIVTLLVAIVFYKSYRNYKLLLVIVTLNVVTELGALYCIINKQSIVSIYNFNFIAHQTLWLYLLTSVFKKHQKEWFLLSSFLGFSLINLLFIEKNELNYYTFLLGGFIYLIYFMTKSFFNLKQEKLLIFTSKTFILLSAPILYYVGFIFILGFRNSELRNIVIMGEDLYSVISLIVNIIYYSLLIVYIYKSRKSNE